MGHQRGARPTAVHPIYLTTLCRVGSLELSSYVERALDKGGMANRSPGANQMAKSKKNVLGAITIGIARLLQQPDVRKLHSPIKDRHTSCSSMSRRAPNKAYLYTNHS